MGGRLIDWIGFGDYADRPLPAAALANISANGFAQYLSVDTGSILSILDPSIPDWIEFNFGSLTGMFQDLLDVDWSTPPNDGDVFVWDAGSSKLIPVAPTTVGPTDEYIQDLIGAMGINGTGTTFVYDDVTGTIKWDSTITQYTDEMAQDALAAAFAAGTHTNLTITYDDALNKFDFAVTGITGYSAEQAQDDVFGAITGGGGVTAAYNDAGNAFTIIFTGMPVHATQNASFAADLTMANHWIPCNSASAIVVTLPKDATVAFAVDTTLVFDHWGAGGLTFAAESGATVNARGGLTASAGQYAVIQAKKIAANTWRLLGDLA